jgi:hypothetical protein
MINSDHDDSLGSRRFASSVRPSLVTPFFEEGLTLDSLIRFDHCPWAPTDVASERVCSLCSITVQKSRSRRGESFHDAFV